MSLCFGLQSMWQCKTKDNKSQTKSLTRMFPLVNFDRFCQKQAHSPQPMAAKQHEHLTAKHSILDFQKDRNPMSFPESVLPLFCGMGHGSPLPAPQDKGNADSRNKVNPCACMDIHLVWVCIDCYKDWNDSAKIMVKGWIQIQTSPSIFSYCLYLSIWCIACAC